VGWYRSRWNFNFCGITFIPSAMEDGINRCEAMTIFSVIQGFISIIHGASMVGVLGFAYTESIWFFVGEL
jgi:hypothetical protein